MAATAFALIDDGIPHAVSARIAGERVFLSSEAVSTALGWHLEAQGLCRGDVCIPVRERNRLVGPEGIELGELAERLDRPLALDVPAGAAFLGASARERGERLRSREAPEFTLPDLSGKLHSLSDHRGRKVLLLAYASW